MSASTSDKLTAVRDTTNPVVTTVSTARSTGGTTLSCVNLGGWPTVSKVHFITYKKTAVGAIDKSTQCEWEGIRSGTTIGSLTLNASSDGSDPGSDVGDYVEMAATAAYGQNVYEWGSAEHSTTGVHALTSSSTITSSKLITSLNDTNGNEIFKVSPTSSAVNELTLTNAATGTAPAVSATGSDTNIPLKLSGKGTGAVQMFVNGVDQLGAWQSWTPTWTNFTLGNGTLTAKYAQIGKTIFYRFYVTLGSTSSVSGGIIFTLPTTSSASYIAQVPIGSGLSGLSTGSGYMTMTVSWASSTTATIGPLSTNSTYSTLSGTSSTIPFTWTSGSFLTAEGTYEAA